MSELIAPKSIKIGIFRCLKSGVNPEFPDQGTPQGGVVSPLLANIALNGIESLLKGSKRDKRIANPCVRYADDMVVRPERRTVEWETLKTSPGKCPTACVHPLTAFRVIGMSHSERKSRNQVGSHKPKGRQGQD